jgi:hypothetical protein
MQYLVKSFSETEGHFAFPSLNATKVESKLSVRDKRYISPQIQICLFPVKKSMIRYSQRK